VTCCVPAVCDEGKAIILAADKTVGKGFVESEPDIQTVRGTGSVHKRFQQVTALQQYVLDRRAAVTGDLTSV